MARPTAWLLLALVTFAGLVSAWIDLWSAGSCDRALFTALVALFLPIPLVLHWNLPGVAMGSILVFFALMLIRRMGEGLNPLFHGDDAITYAIKTAALLIIAVVFPSVIYGIKQSRREKEAKTQETQKT
jgi:hypothetical protein